MRLPRRVPWASIGELEQVCSWIFADETDLDSKILAINRLSAWRAITYLPHALDSTLAILAVIIHDTTSQDGITSYLSLRQSYATAIIRLVNGLVDPLQLGAYARSIASIAAQLGLPSWLVELRHASTHEDLPSLELLREGARESMSWLLHNYFLPTINPTSAVQPQSSPLRPLGPLLKRYKNISKITTKDASLRTQYKPEMNILLRDIERWVSEAKVASNLSTSGFGWDAGDAVDSSEYDIKERWALERLCDALLEKGILVPVSKKKRTFPADSFYPPSFSVALWSSLLSHLFLHHPELPGVLAARIVSYILSDLQVLVKPLAPGQTIPDIYHHDMSFDMCLGRWAMWIIDTFSDSDEAAESDTDLEKDITISLITAFGPSGSDSTRDRKAALELLQALCARNPDLQKPLNVLLPSAAGSPEHVDWDSDDISIMDQRLNVLLSSRTTLTPPDKATQSLEDSSAPQRMPLQADGWKLLGEEWKPCPIGMPV